MKSFIYTRRTCRACAAASRRFLSSAFHPSNALSNRPRAKLERPPATHQSPFMNPNPFQQEIKHEQRKIRYFAISAITCMTIIYLLASQYGEKELRADAPPSSISKFPRGSQTPIIIPKESISIRESPTTKIELVDSGTTSVPPIPKRLYIPLLSDPTKEEEYTLIGYGIRTVSFIKMEVYVVAFYVHSSDLPILQQFLIRKVNLIATTAIQPEQDQVFNLLTDPETGPKLLQETLLDGGDKGGGHKEESPQLAVRSLFRIVPTRNTDWAHLRDGWVRGIQSRAPLVVPQQEKLPSQISDLSSSIQLFKSLFQSGLPNTGKSVPKQKTILLLRSHDPEQPRGTLTVLYDPSGRNDGKVGNQENEKEKLQLVGQVKDERISRALWLCYLGGKQVASEEARRRVVEGLVGLTSRQMGTVGSTV